MAVRVHVYVSGRVQGIFFRSFVATMARRLDVRGWVRNLYDGRVEAVFEGERESVDEMINYCRRGPPGALVEGLEVLWEDYKGEFKDFSIRRTV
ncbi:MAG: acylphosphatase [Candidatus Brockarchaeota archaeon]|nr:acylphosphatase [Candidatus Brockarchaeota archaeon]